MKKIYSLIALIIILACNFFNYFNIINVYATSNYMRVINNETPFYQTPEDTKPLFYLPYTYYVKVLGQTDQFTHVEIHGNDGVLALDGYVPSHLLFADGLSVDKPYLSLDLITIQTAVLYSDQSLNTPSQYVFADRKLTYYGVLNTDNGNIYYVGYNNRLGYVKESDILPFTISNHPNELTFIVEPTPPESDVEMENNNDFFALKTIIIVCLLFAGIIALFIALGKKNPAQKPIYYEENDYE